MSHSGAQMLQHGFENRHSMIPAGQVAPMPQSPTLGPVSQSKAPRSSQRPPVWAQVQTNRVRDERRMKLAETRPELAAVFRTDSPAGPPAETPPAGGRGRDPELEQEKIPLDRLTISSREPAASFKAVLKGGSSVEEAAPSIANMASSDETKVLAGWILEQTTKISDDSLLERLEIEFKMGLITEAHGLRHRFNVSSECVVDPSYYQQHRLRFKSDVSPQRFRSLETLLDKIVTTNALTPSNRLTRDRVYAQDSVYNLAYEPLGPGRSNIRVSRDESGHIRECFSKKRIGDLYIAVPNGAYDLKVSMSYEHPVDVERFLPLIEKESPSFVRRKDRSRWLAPGCEIDLTAVKGQARGKGLPSSTKEAEIEMNTQLLIDSLRGHRIEGDPKRSLDKFLNVVRYSMDSARFLARNI